jgi:hypothetical protein
MSILTFTLKILYYSMVKLSSEYICFNGQFFYSTYLIFLILTLSYRQIWYASYIPWHYRLHICVIDTSPVLYLQLFQYLNYLIFRKPCFHHSRILLCLYFNQVSNGLLCYWYKFNYIICISKNLCNYL